MSRSAAGCGLSMQGPDPASGGAWLRARAASRRPGGSPMRHPHRLLTLLVAIGSIVTAATADEVWVQRWDGPAGHNDQGRFVAHDAGGGILVAGSTYDPDIDVLNDHALVRLDLQGELLWSRQYGDTASATITDALLRTEPAITSGLRHGDGEVAIATVAHDLSGERLWEHRVAITTSTHTSEGARLVRGVDGRIHVGATTDDRFLLIEYSPAGDLLRQATIDTGEGPSMLLDIAVDDLGGVYLAGLVADPDLGPVGLTIVKVDTDGQVAWQHGETGDVGSVFPRLEIAVAPDGTIVAAGNYETSCGVFGLRTWAMAPADGMVLWSYDHNAVPCDSYLFDALALAPDGRVGVTAHGGAIGEDVAIHTIVHEPDGELRWHRSWAPADHAGLEAADLAFDDAGTAHVAGTVWSTPQDLDMATIAYAADGQERRVATWASLGSHSERSAALDVDEAGRAVLTGYGYNDALTTDLLAVLYPGLETTAASPPARGAALDLHARLNPFSARTVVGFSLPRPTVIRLEVHDLRGRRLRTLRAGPAAAGDHAIVWRGRDDRGRSLPSGTYLLRLTTGRGMAVERIGLVR
ncbi:hypothetical protein GF314_12385 [bacterium]|nr:hypothetical protein [bacterium]